MDGVVVDSEPILLEAVTRLLAEKGVALRPADCQPFLGTGEDHLLEGVAARHGVTLDLPRDVDRLYALYLELIPDRLKAEPGVFDFLAEARRRHLKVALASSAAAIKVEHNLREVGLTNNSFDAVVNAGDVRCTKPHPDIFLTAARRLGLPPAACLVVEDAVAGVQAARGGGLPLPGPDHHHSRRAPYGRRLGRPEPGLRSAGGLAVMAERTHVERFRRRRVKLEKGG
jgi:cytidine deaminase